MVAANAVGLVLIAWSSVLTMTADATPRVETAPIAGADVPDPRH
ncbi:hypothetical protein [Streptomyces sp. NPDC051577]